MSKKKTEKMRKFSKKIEKNKDENTTKRIETEEFRRKIAQYERRKDNEEKEEQRRKHYQKNIQTDCKLERDSYTSNHDREIFEK